MYIDPFVYRTTQQYLEEQIAEAQVCHARQRRLVQHLGQAVGWVGHRLIAWSQRLQLEQQPWERPETQTTV